MTLHPDDDATSLALLTEQLNTAKGAVERFKRMDAETLAPKYLSRLESLVANHGPLPNFIGDTPLKWYYSLGELRDAIIAKIEEAGIPISKSLEDSDIVFKRGEECARFVEAKLWRGQSRPVGPTIIHIRQDFKYMRPSDRYEIIRYKLLDAGYEPALTSRSDLNEALSNLPSECLSSGRAIGFREIHSGFEMLPTSRWAKSSRIEKNDRFLLTCEVPVITAAQKSEPAPPEQTVRVKKAISQLEQMYRLAEFVDRKLKRATATRVFCNLFDLSDSLFEASVWGAAHVPDWKKPGRIAQNMEITASELREFLDALN